MGTCFSSIGQRDTAQATAVPRSPGSATIPSTSPSKPQSSGRWKGKYGKNIKNSKTKKKKGRGVAAADEDELHRIPERLFLNGASNMACLFTQQGKKGTNQDAMLVWEKFSSRNDTTLCGVFDGHGPYGHLVAKVVRDSLPLLLCKHWKAISNCDQSSICENGNGSGTGSTNSEETASLSMDDLYEPLEVEEKEDFPEMYLLLKQSMLKAFKMMDKELKLHPTVDCFCSGTTAVTLLKQGRDLVIGNIGDSRAILATRDKDNSLVAVQLTIDLKPNLPREAARIQRCKGRVFALQDEPEVSRVWLPNSDSPGLAMARAFGDFCLKDFGLISIPDIFYRCLTERDEFIVLATDGIWDVLSNKEVVDIVASAPGQATAARALVDCAVRAWRLKYPTSKIDDCAAVCLFLKQQLSQAGHALAEHESTGTTEGAETTRDIETNGVWASHPDAIEDSNTTDLHVQGSREIVPVSEEKSTERRQDQSKRTLAEFISTAEEEWSALEGVTRVNSLISLPRFLSGNTRSSASWRKWL